MSLNSDLLLISGASILSSSSSGTINIGKTGQSIILTGDNNTISNTNLEIKDKLLTLNKNGLAASAGGSGIEFEENGTITSYIKVSSDRNDLVFKAPNGTEKLFNPNSDNIKFMVPIKNQSFSESTSNGTTFSTFTLANNSNCFFMFNGSAYSDEAFGRNATLTLSISGGTTLSTINHFFNETNTTRPFPTGFASASINAGTYTLIIKSSTNTDTSHKANCAIIAIKN